MACSTEGLRRAKRIVKYYTRIFKLDQAIDPGVHGNYLYDDGSRAHAFLCTDLMRPRQTHRNPNTLTGCRVKLAPDPLHELRQA